MDKQAPIFEKVYRDYLKQIGELDLEALARRMGCEFSEGSVVVPFFSRLYRVAPEGIKDPRGAEPLHAVKVVLCKYLLMFPDPEPLGEEDWVAYRDFKDAAPFVGGFQTNSERSLARRFSDRLEELRGACVRLDGTDPGLDWNYQLRFRFDALSRVPMLLLFNDVDEEFPAQCLVLFQRRAERYLDMECLAIEAWLLADFLRQAAGEKDVATVM